MPSLYIVIPTIIAMKLYNYKLPCHVDGLNKHVQYLLCDNKLELHGWLTSSNMRILKWPSWPVLWKESVGFSFRCLVRFHNSRLFISWYFFMWKKQNDYGLGFVFSGHLHCFKLFVLSLPAAVFILLGAGCCLWDVAGLIWGFLEISNLTC